MAVAAFLVLLLLLLSYPGRGPSPPTGSGSGAIAPACVPPSPACPSVDARAAPLAGGDVWSNVTSTQVFSPGPRVGASLALDPSDNYLVLFGGCSATQCPVSAQTWKFSGGFWTNISATVGVQPPARAFASMVDDSRDGYVLLFGGIGPGGVALNDTWSFTGGSWHNLTNFTTAPPARSAATLAFDHLDNYALLFGGRGTNATIRNDTWQFNGGTWRNLTRGAGTPPPARFGAAMTYDVGDATTVLFGGCGAVCPLGGTFEFARGRWTALTPTTSPPARQFGTLTYSGLENITYLFGGNGTSGGLSDLWRFAGGKWSVLGGGMGTPPAPRYGQAALESTVSWSTAGSKHLGFSLIYGGTNATCITCGGPVASDTWVIEPALGVSGNAVPSVVESGQPATFSASAIGGTGPYSYLWKFGDGSSQAAGTATHAYAAPGTFVANVTATDSAGVPAVASATVTVLAGPTARMSAQPSPTDVGRPVAFTGSVSGGSPPYTMTWSFGDLTSGAGLTATHAYGAPGNYSVEFQATDAVLGYGDSFGRVIVNPLPSIDAIASTSTPEVGSNVSFSASVSGGTGPFVYLWSFGDGGTATTASATHVFASAGSTTVSVEVSDAVGGSAWDNFTVSVQAGGASHATGIPLEWVGAGVAVGAAVLLLLLWFFLRRRRRPQSGVLAAAPAENPPWPDGDPEGTPRSKRALRRDTDRFYRRRG